MPEALHPLAREAKLLCSTANLHNSAIQNWVHREVRKALIDIDHAARKGLTGMHVTPSYYSGFECATIAQDAFKAKMESLGYFVTFHPASAFDCPSWFAVSWVDQADGPEGPS